MDLFFYFLLIPFVLHAVGNYYVDNYASGISLNAEEES